jgi:type II secretory pathway pseudopilin PulG
MIFNTKNKNTGFTLIEMFVAIFIFTLSTVAFISVVSRSMYSIRDSLQTVTAQNLAQEGIELIEARQISNFYEDLDGQGTDKLEWIAGDDYCGDTHGCIVDPMKSISNPEYISKCTEPCNVILFDDSENGMYGYQSGSSTSFTRTIKVTGGADDDEYTITSTVTWKSGNVEREVTYEKKADIWEPFTEV